MKTAAARPARPAWSDRFLAALPLLLVFVFALLLYAWEAWSLSTPWVFTDEVENAQLARAFAETGHPALRGEVEPLRSLSRLLSTPAWWIDDAQSAYDAAKYLGVLAMSLAAFPAYWLARLVAAPAPALFAAAASVAIPAFMYASMLLEEPLAYTYSTLCLFLIAKALATRGRGWYALAAAAALGAPFVRGQLVVIPAVFVLAGTFLAWRSEPARRHRLGWSRWDWAGAVLLAGGAVVLVSSELSQRSEAWRISTRLYQGRMLELGLSAGGALALGLGILPVVVGLAALLRSPDEPRAPAVPAFAAVVMASLVGFGLYAAVKAAYLSSVFATRVPERNVIYLAPPLLAATALWLSRPRLRLPALAASAAFGALLLLVTPQQLEFPYFEAPGFSILALVNRSWEWSPGRIELWTFFVLLAAVALALLPGLLEGRRLALRAVLVAAAVAVLAWNVTGQLAAASGARIAADLLHSNLPRPPDWVDRRTGGAPTLYLGQPGLSEPTGIHLLEFWNRSVERVWSLDGLAPGPGPTLTPDLAAPDGRLSHGSEFEYVVTDTNVDLQGKVLEEQLGLRLIRPAKPLRLRTLTGGIYSDGWTGGFASRNVFTTPGGRAGYMLVRLSREAWGGQDVPGTVVVNVGTLVLDANRQPQIGRRVDTSTYVIDAGEREGLILDTPPPPFRVEVTIDPTFVPAQLDSRSGDTRELGAQVGFEFRLERP
ncbi:MAG: hypothetical protein H0V40_00375 [Actinobacteria bacterium]|nr:hypothetical protein [Actinomycetota bacterium]